MSATAKSLLGRKTLLVITGASRGLGRAMAVNMAPLLGNDSLMLLMARDSEKLADLKKELLSENSGDEQNLQTREISIDLGNLDNVHFDQILVDAIGNHEPDVAMIIHNAATVGDVTKGSAQLADVSELRQYFDLNLTSCIALNSHFLTLTSNIPTVTDRLVVNVSSGAAWNASTGSSLYCAGKAARELFFQTLALENPSSLRVLSFSPGPLVTDMMREINTKSFVEDNKEWSKNVLENGIPPEQSLGPLVTALEENTFESGSFLSFNKGLRSMAGVWSSKS